MKKQALGKGIRAFVPEEFGILKEERMADVPIGQVRPNPLQPRKKFDDAAIQELSRSIKASGVLQPIVVVPEGDHYKIIIGERRWRAAQRAGLQKVPVLIRNVPRARQVEISLVENLQREDLNPLEVAQAYEQLMRETGLTQQELADKVGLDRSTVANTLRLLKLPEEVQEMLALNKLSMGHARAILALDEPSRQLAMARQIVSGSLSVRQAEAQVRGKRKKSPSGKKAGLDAELRALQEHMVRILGTKVEIVGSRRRGAVKIHFFSLDELNRIYDLIKGVRS
ncbi:MAG: ParB/RepB/Spo0J family partition protein [Candidatus Aminicenantes bacterium]|nr:ParB/RepB/Spo0J family partition protein [Candidatus Aminicenantes bacterium]